MHSNAFKKAIDADLTHIVPIGYRDSGLVQVRSSGAEGTFIKS